jgi:hypothetical protein
MWVTHLEAAKVHVITHCDWKVQQLGNTISL